MAVTKVRRPSGAGDTPPGPGASLPAAFPPSSCPPAWLFPPQAAVSLLPQTKAWGQGTGRARGRAEREAMLWPCQGCSLSLGGFGFLGFFLHSSATLRYFPWGELCSPGAVGYTVHGRGMLGPSRGVGTAGHRLPLPCVGRRVLGGIPGAPHALAVLSCCWEPWALMLDVRRRRRRRRRQQPGSGQRQRRCSIKGSFVPRSSAPACLSFSVGGVWTVLCHPLP